MPPRSAALATLALLAAAAAAAIAAFVWLACGYRRTLERALRERHPAVWAELAAPPAAGRWSLRRRPLARFLRAGRHYTLNDADLAAAGRLYGVTWWASVAAGMTLVAVMTLMALCFTS